jgi:hypothetical protein
MTTPVPDPGERLLALLDTLPEEERRSIVLWLLHRGHASHSGGVNDLTWYGGGAPAAARLRRLASGLPAGEESQLVTIRLPAERHAELRDWCSDHGFTMAAVVRGLVERFLEQQRPADPEAA